MLRRRLIRRWAFQGLLSSIASRGPHNPAVSLSGPGAAAAAATAPGAASTAASASNELLRAPSRLLSPSPPMRRDSWRPYFAATRRLIETWDPLHSSFRRGLCNQVDSSIAAATAAAAARAATAAVAAAVASDAGPSTGALGMAAAPHAASASDVKSDIGLVQVDIKRDQQRFLRMLGPIRDALLARIAARAPQEAAEALTSYYTRVIDYNCTGGKMLRGLLTVYASLAANQEVKFVHPSQSAATKAAATAEAASAASPAPADAPSVFRLAAALSGAAVVSSTAAAAGRTVAASGTSGDASAPSGSAAAAGAAAVGAAAIEDAFNSGACALGWGVELLQAAFLVADDQMDGAHTRRGKVCWYRRPEVGPANAINDSVFLIYAIHQVLRELLGRHPAFNACSNLMQDVAFNTVLGQHLDSNGGVHALLQQPQQQEQQQQQQQELLRVLREKSAAAAATLQQLTAAARCRQKAAARLKTSYYSFWLPTALGMASAASLNLSVHADSGVNDQSLLAKAEEICLCTGDYFQAQDDFLDCFGCPDALGKSGTDIREGKCGWLLVEALAAATPAEAAELLEAYGRPEGEATVREMYVHLKLQERFKDYENGACDKILK